ncbi:hypothetical protein I350_01626 [Cryptococcus amylolentus CBS 6273]|uniref:Uncharacterized protein n=1 Tax=Cryptococcus amylolentus CBS 6273 TaxID=1296118 RepID=A0A1E3KDI9_9TREE|nr:hypothetical protein I350_01626 [Cryptococcus amylolentus CBS 6273]
MASKPPTRKSTRTRQSATKSLEVTPPEKSAPAATNLAQSNTEDKRPVMSGFDSDSSLSPPPKTDGESNGELDGESESEEEPAPPVPTPKVTVKASTVKTRLSRVKSKETPKAKNASSADEMDLDLKKEAESIPRGRGARKRIPESSAEPSSETVSPALEVAPTPQAPRNDTPPPGPPPDDLSKSTQLPNTGVVAEEPTPVTADSMSVPAEPKPVPAEPISPQAELVPEKLPEPLSDATERKEPRKENVKLKTGATDKIFTPGLPLDQDDLPGQPEKEGKKQGKRTSGYMTEGDVDEGVKRPKMGIVREASEKMETEEGTGTATEKAEDRSLSADERPKPREQEEEGQAPKATEQLPNEGSKTDSLKRSVSLKKKKSRQQILSEDESDEDIASTPAASRNKSSATIHAPSSSPHAAKPLPSSPRASATPSPPRRSAKSVPHKKQTPGHPSSTPAHAKSSTKAATGVTAKPKPKPKAVAKLESSSGAPAKKTPTSSPASSTPAGAKPPVKKVTAKRPVQSNGSTPASSTPKMKAATGSVPSLLKQTMGSLRHAKTDDGKRVNEGSKDQEERDKQSRRGKGDRGDGWVMTPDERKQYEATRGQREAERKVRDSWNVRPINLQETQDAWHIYCDQPPALNYKAGWDDNLPDSIKTEDVASSVLRNVLGY